MALTIDRVRRFGGVIGILFVVTGAVALVLPGAPPKADEVAKIGTYFADKRSEILASDYVVGIAFVLFLLFVGAMRAYLGAGDRDGLRPGAGMLAGAAAATALTLGGTAVVNGAVFQVAAANDTNLNHALYDIASDLFVMAGFGFGAFFLGAAVAITNTGALPSALAPAAVMVGVLNVIAPIALFVKTGFFAIGGAFGWIVPVLSLLWVVAASVAMLRGPAATRAAPAAT
jgi:hypothetical protein